MCPKLLIQITKMTLDNLLYAYHFGSAKRFEEKIQHLIYIMKELSHVVRNKSLTDIKVFSETAYGQRHGISTNQLENQLKQLIKY